MADLVDIKDRRPNPELIEMLERGLDHARKGDLRGAFVVYSWNDDTVSSGWSLDFRNTKRRMLAEIALGQLDFMAGIAVSDGDGTFAKAIRGDL